MDKNTYAIITPDPYGETKKLVILARDLGDIFTATELSETTTYKIKIVRRTERWFDQFPEI